MTMDQTKIFELWRGMLRIRMVEEAIAEHYPEQEALPCTSEHRAGSRCSWGLYLQKKDWVSVIAAYLLLG